MNSPQADNTPHVLGWHDSHCAGAAILSRDGRILYAAAEERFTGRKLQKGYPARTFDDISGRFNVPDIMTCYADMPLPAKAARNIGLLCNTWKKGLNTSKSAGRLVKTALSRIARRQANGVAGRQVGRALPDRISPPMWGRARPTRLCEHHTAHAAGAYFLSGFDDAYVVTIDGVGDCLSGAVFVGAHGKLTRRRAFYYNDLTVGADYEVFTAMLGFDPDRHCGKITGLAALGKRNDACITALDRFFKASWRRGRRNFFDLMHASDRRVILSTAKNLRRRRETEFGRFGREDLAHAMQYLAEQRVLKLIRENVPDIPGTDIALAGGVFANVRINQKVKELGFRNIFVQPAMDDGGLSLGAALYGLSQTTDLRPHRLADVFVGPGYSEERIADALDRAGMAGERVEHLPYAVAKLVADDKVVARFDGRMEFGPRALGNRSILYGTGDPSVNQWLNKRLRRSEFMPFAPAPLADHADACYLGLDGCRRAVTWHSQ